MSTMLLRRRMMMVAKKQTVYPAPNEIWVWPLTISPDASLVQNATYVGSGQVRGLQVWMYDNPVIMLNKISYTPGGPSIIVFPEGMTGCNETIYWNRTMQIEHLYVPSTCQYVGQRMFRSGINYIHHAWLAWDSAPQYVEYDRGYDKIENYHIKAGLKAAYVAAGWPETKLKEDYKFDPWSNIQQL